MAGLRFPVMRAMRLWPLLLCAMSSTAFAQESALGLIELRFKPIGRAQLAIWIEAGDGTFVTTARLTEAVAYRGIGNRPGASQMNSGFRWPYGRREGVLPVWAHRRASAPDARPFRRVIFQDRESEGQASRTSNDQTRDDYYCLSFNTERSSRDALDAMSCASVFSSDKGRFITASDIEAQYSEPYEPEGGVAGIRRPLSLESLYPPRHDIAACDKRQDPLCLDHIDSLTYGEHVREVMPDIDAVTMATPAGNLAQNILMTIPADWQAGAYRACIEINVEGDYNQRFGPEAYPTPQTPMESWDSYALDYGYPYRGQPSVVYCVDFEIGDGIERKFSTQMAEGSSGRWDLESPDYGQLRSMEGVSDDPIGAPGSGADRLLTMEDGSRFGVVVKPSLTCSDDKPPSKVGELTVEQHPDAINAHRWARVSFRAASDDHGIARYDVRVSTEPITDDTSFESAVRAKEASEEAAELRVPIDGEAGEVVRVEVGGLVEQTHYFVAVRALDGCAADGPFSVEEIETTARQFTTVTPCFVATAAWGDPLAQQVFTLRGFRDRYLRSTAFGRALVSAYYDYGPRFAAMIREHEWLRSATRGMLAPIVSWSRELQR
jgi:hypothetical protein